jgi:hypothetical protein
MSDPSVTPRISLTPYFLLGPEWDDHLDENGYWDPQCTITTRRGTRCQHRIFAGQVYAPWAPFDRRMYITQQDAEIFHAGMCALHAKLHRDAAKKG